MLFLSLLHFFCMGFLCTPQSWYMAWWIFSKIFILSASSQASTPLGICWSFVLAASISVKNWPFRASWFTICWAMSVLVGPTSVAFALNVSFTSSRSKQKQTFSIKFYAPFPLPRRMSLGPKWMTTISLWLSLSMQGSRSLWPIPALLVVTILVCLKQEKSGREIRFKNEFEFQSQLLMTELHHQWFYQM